MYELAWQERANWRTAVGDQAVPPPPPDKAVEKVGLLMWQEHCVECAVPHCYRSCPLYIERRDHKCARFAFGIVPNRQVSGLFGFGADITFRRWGKIEARWPGRPRLFALDKLRNMVSRLNMAEQAAIRVADALGPLEPRRRLYSAFWRFLERPYIRRNFQEPKASAPRPHGLYVKYFLDARENRNLHLEISYDRPVFRTVLKGQSGWNEHVIPYEEHYEKPGEAGYIRIWPEDDRDLRVIFTWLDVVAFRAEEPAPQKEGRPVPAAKVKCVAWDLDDTFWKGVIGEVGANNVEPSAAALELVEHLDRRGIVQSIVSKNDHEVAWPKIEELGMADFFLYPAINWGPKSESLRRLAEHLNINLDSIAVIDDSAFERSEIASVLPQVHTYGPEEIDGLLSRDEFDVPVTETSRMRRQAYQNEAKRNKIAAEWGSDYDAFLESCEMVMRIDPPCDAESAKRCLELLQRSNQFNLSAQHYRGPEFKDLLGNSSCECFAAEVSDKFGAHGIVGFLAVEMTNEAPTLFEFVMSCRVAQKKVEESLILWLARRMQRRGHSGLRVRLRVTERNGPLRRSLEALPFELMSESNTEQVLNFRFEEEIQVPTVIRIEGPSTKEKSLTVDA